MSEPGVRCAHRPGYIGCIVPFASCDRDVDAFTLGSVGPRLPGYWPKVLRMATSQNVDHWITVAIGGDKGSLRAGVRIWLASFVDPFDKFDFWRWMTPPHASVLKLLLGQLRSGPYCDDEDQPECASASLDEIVAAVGEMLFIVDEPPTYLRDELSLWDGPLTNMGTFDVASLRIFHARLADYTGRNARLSFRKWWRADDIQGEDFEFPS